MSHLEARLEKDLREIRQRMADQANQVQYALKQALQSLRTGSRKLAFTTVLHDHPINRSMRMIDNLCHKFIAVHLPSAGNLRLISSVMRANIELERIGDYAVIIAREAVQLSAPPGGITADDLSFVAGESMTILDQATRSFDNLDAETAISTMALADRLESHLSLVYNRMMAESNLTPGQDLFAMFSVFTQLKRVADQAKNICEDTVFAVSGNPKSPKTYPMLFVDQTNTLYSQMAQAIAQIQFPHSGRYSSVGFEAAETVNPALVAFMRGRGIALDQARPAALSTLSREEIAAQRIIVVINGDSKVWFPEIPFHTSIIEWEIEPMNSESTAQFENLYRNLSIEIKDLIELLRGEGAN